MFGIRAIAREVAKTREMLERLHADQNQFMREERLRANKVLEPLIASHNKLIGSHDELVADARAQREGFLALIDELRGGRGLGGTSA